MHTTHPLEYWFIFKDEQVLLINSDPFHLLLPTALDLPFKSELKRTHKLVETSDYSVYCAELDTTPVLPTAMTSLSLRKTLEQLGDTWFPLAVKAYGIITWDKNHQFCGRCGQATIKHPTLFERRCDFCTLTFYPRISPSIIVRIQKNDELLMARSPHFLAGVYALIAGFVEVGETIEEAVRREVMEEVGIKIKNLQYFGSQAWPFPDSLMIAFTAEYESGNLQINHEEIEDAGWYRYDRLPGRPSSSISIARKLIDDFIALQNKIHKDH